MIKAFDLAKIIKLLMVVLSAMFLLTACSSGNDDDKTTPVPQSQTTGEKEKINEEHSKCWQASIVKVLYETLGKASMEMYSKITNGAIAVMMIAFAIWFAHKIMLHVSSVTEENIAEVWKEVLQKFFICFVCGYLASSPAMLLWVLNMLIFPLYNAFLEFGSAILAATDYEASGGSSTVLGETITFKQNLVCRVSGSSVADLNSGFPTGPQEMMSCMVCSVSERLGIGRMLAFKVLGGSNSGFVGWIVGIVVFLVFTFVKLGFVFYLVDTLFRMAVMTVILPILIMSFAFQKTREWTKKGFFIILNSAAFAAFIAILMTTALLAMEEIFIKNPAIFGGDSSEAETNLKELSVTFICILLICFLLVSSVGVAGQLSGSLVGGRADPKFQKKLKIILEMAASWVTGGAFKGIKRMANAVKKK